MNAPTLLINVGEPRPGFIQLWNLILGAGAAYRTYCNGDARGHDLVTDVPFNLPGEEYRHGADSLHLEASPADPSDHGPFRYHHIELYQAGILKLNPVPTLGIGLSDVEIINFIAATYRKPGTVPVDWDYFDDGDDDGVCWGLKYLDDADLAAYRGSVTLPDWLHDALAIARRPQAFPKLGPVHWGFYAGMPRAITELQARRRPGVPLIMGGHSLGAGHASIGAGILCSS